MDHFALFGLPRRPWLETDELKALFHRLTAETHPDRTGETAASAALNAAYATLRDPAARLRHWLELEHPEALTGPAEVPPEMASLFMRLATLRRAVEAFREQQAGATTPLGQALLGPERFALRRDVEKETHALEEVQNHCLAEVRALDAASPHPGPAAVEQLARRQRELTYYGRWLWQLREALFGLQTDSETL